MTSRLEQEAAIREAIEQYASDWHLTLDDALNAIFSDPRADHGHTVSVYPRPREVVRRA